MTSFVSPSAGGGGDRLAVGDINGHHVIINPLSIEMKTTTYGESEAVRLNLADLTTGLAHCDVLWFGKGILYDLRKHAGTGALVLGTIGQGTPGTAGQSPPWKIIDATMVPEVVAAAQAWLDANPGVIAGAIATPSPAANLAPVANLAPTAPLGSLI